MAYSTIHIEFDLINYESLYQKFKEIETAGIINIINITCLDEETGFKVELINSDSLSKDLKFLFDITDNMEFYEDGYITCESETADWDYTDCLVKFLAPYVSNGRLVFTKENGDQWAYKIDENKVYRIETIETLIELL